MLRLDVGKIITKALKEAKAKDYNSHPRAYWVGYWRSGDKFDYKEYEESRKQHGPTTRAR